MPRAYLALSLLALVPLACGDDTASTAGATDATSTASTTDTSTSTAVPTTDVPTTGGGPGTITGITTDTTTGETTSATGPTSDPGTSVGPTSDPGTTTEGPGVCGVDGPHVAVSLVQIDEPPSPCGPIEFTGTRISDEKGPVWMLDGCACGQNCLIPDPWSLNVSAPPEWLPLIPECPRIVVDRAMAFGGCEFTGISVWDLADPNAPAVYHAGHGFSPTQAAQGELELASQSLGTCACDGCCGPDELFRLHFDMGGMVLVLDEGESGKLGAHDVINLESHQRGLCDASSDVHWVVRRPG